MDVKQFGGEFWIVDASGAKVAGPYASDPAARAALLTGTYKAQTQQGATSATPATGATDPAQSGIGLVQGLFGTQQEPPKPTRPEAQVLYYSGQVDRAQLEKWFGPESTTALLAETVTATQVESIERLKAQGTKYAPPALPATAPTPEGKETGQAIRRGLGELGEATQRIAAGADVFGAEISKDKLASNLKDGVPGFTPEKVYQSLIVSHGMQPDDAVAFLVGEGALAPGSTVPGGATGTANTQTGEQAASASAGGATGASASGNPWIDALRPIAERYEAQYGIPAEVLLAINASETNWGAAGGLNGPLFGIKGPGVSYDTHEVNPDGSVSYINDSFRSYNSPEEAYADFIDLVSTAPRYADAWSKLQAGDWQGFMQGINAAGYATDPGWATMITGLANRISGGEIPASTASATGAQATAAQTSGLIPVEPETPEAQQARAAQMLAAARARYEAAGADVFQGNDGTLRIEMPETGYVFDVGLDKDGNLVEGPPHISSAVRARSVEPLSPRTEPMAPGENAVTSGDLFTTAVAQGGLSRIVAEFMARNGGRVPSHEEIQAFLDQDPAANRSTSYSTTADPLRAQNEAIYAQTGGRFLYEDPTRRNDGVTVYERGQALQDITRQRTQPYINEQRQLVPGESVEMPRQLSSDVRALLGAGYQLNPETGMAQANMGIDPATGETRYRDLTQTEADQRARQQQGDPAAARAEIQKHAQAMQAQGYQITGPYSYIDPRTGEEVNTGGKPVEVVLMQLRQQALEEGTFVPGQARSFAGGVARFAGGGSFMAGEPIMGVGLVSRRPRFLIGEGGKDERITIEPTDKDITLGRELGKRIAERLGAQSPEVREFASGGIGNIFGSGGYNFGSYFGGGSGSGGLFGLFGARTSPDGAFDERTQKILDDTLGSQQLAAENRRRALAGLEPLDKPSGRLEDATEIAPNLPGGVFVEPQTSRNADKEKEGRGLFGGIFGGLFGRDRERRGILGFADGGSVEVINNPFSTPAPGVSQPAVVSPQPAAVPMPDPAVLRQIVAAFAGKRTKGFAPAPLGTSAPPLPSGNPFSMTGV